MRIDEQKPGVKKEEEHEKGNTVLLADPFRIKLRVRSADLGESPPQSWKEVARQVNRHLMRIAAGSTRLVSEVIEGTTRLVRGISEVPAAMARRIERVHVVSDVAEEMKQEQVHNAEEIPCPDEALKRINEILERYRVEGFVAGISFDKNGRAVVIVVRPEHGGIAEEVAKDQISDGGMSERKRIEARKD